MQFGLKTFVYACMSVAVFSTPAGAQAHADDNLPAIGETCATPNAASEEAADQQAFDHAMQAFQAGGFGALSAYTPQLQTAMAHAPSCYPQVEISGDNVYVRADDQNELNTLGLAAGAVLGTQGHQHVNVSARPNTYPRISLMLGSIANERHDFSGAITWLDRGLALQPHNQFLVAEKSTSLGQLGRTQEAYDLLKAELDNPLNLALDQSRFQRMAGELLIDLNRLGDAESAFNESIRLQPNNPIARSELAYITQLRRSGRVPERAQLVAPNAPPSQTQ
jgi:tetratricopeptide (TPR) repeat protein